MPVSPDGKLPLLTTRSGTTSGLLAVGFTLFTARQAGGGDHENAVLRRDRSCADKRGIARRVEQAHSERVLAVAELRRIEREAEAGVPSVREAAPDRADVRAAQSVNRFAHLRAIDQHFNRGNADIVERPARTARRVGERGAEVGRLQVAERRELVRRFDRDGERAGHRLLC